MTDGACSVEDVLDTELVICKVKYSKMEDFCKFSLMFPSPSPAGGGRGLGTHPSEWLSACNE